MIFSYFKFIVAIVFMINMLFSKINCNDKAVALQKIVYDEETRRFMTERVNDYLNRNTKMIDERTGLPYSYNLLHKRYKYDNEPMDENCFYINNGGQLIMNDDQASDNCNKIPQMYITTMNVMKKKEANLVNPAVPIFHYKILYDQERQVQFYRYLLYPYENENIYHYWNRVDTKLKSCLLNEDRFEFIDVKVQHIDYIGFEKVLVPRNTEMTDEEYANLTQINHMWFYNMISTKPITGEGVPNYYLRNIRLGFSSLTLNNLKIFYNDYILNEKKSLKIYEIKNNFFTPEAFILHIIMHCKLPQSEFVEYTENEPPKKNKRERGESFSSKKVRGMNP